jgi:hypothetical protein
LRGVKGWDWPIRDGGLQGIGEASDLAARDGVEIPLASQIILKARTSAGGATLSRGIMRDEYDFSKPQCGKIYRPGAELAFLAARAAARGVSLSELVNTLLKKDIELIEVAQ